MTFKVGDEVRIIALGKRGRIVGAAGADRFRVSAGGLTVLAAAEGLALVEAPKKKRIKTATNTPSPVAGPADAGRTGRLASLDLHGCTADEAISHLEVALDRAITAGVDRLNIIHGIGTGTVKRAVHSYLSRIPVVRRYALDAGNAGVTIAWL